ncbi:hypothetical protein EHQ46_06030 [Leptospira yanagawae]|uniref:Uncharacterized protein n=1 Tax=Leptospira yanagawae TaxID=293069 RepID=A0ABY2M571_9LEPT|nr:hypothetical protein [Leptospira yanagawae]TGL23073.1 hypothetical protein EHQ46_06030 [Leptospira yanagawae]
MNKKYRTIIILEKNENVTNFIFGHSILWEKTELDYTIEKWTKKDISNFTIWFSDITESELNDIESSLLSNNFDFKGIQLCNGSPFFSEDNQFLEPDSPKFNPFITLCTKRKIYYRKPIYLSGLDQYLQDRESILKEIRDNFGIDLISYPFMFDTFSIYKPSRLFFRIHGDKESKKALIIKAYDEFKQYNESDVEITIYNDSEEHFIHKFKLDTLYTKNKIECGFNPSRAIIEVTNPSKETVYKTDNYFIKKIVLTMGIGKTPIQTDSGVVRPFSSETFEIGGDE